MTAFERAVLKMLAQNFEERSDAARRTEKAYKADYDAAETDEDKRHALYEQAFAAGMSCGLSGAKNTLKTLLDALEKDAQTDN